jgi:hypothetical protein
LDVQAPELRLGSLRISWFAIATIAVLLLAAALRLKGIHDPILDHPNWRQGDTAAIARNFSTRKFDILYPQTNYDGPPPNYVELELQIVPFLAATLYKVFGVHEIFGRLITLLFSLGTVGVLALFGRWLFNNWAAGVAAATAYAIMPGAIYYGRTFTPDAAMVFFLTAALYACARLLVEDEVVAPRSLARTTALVTLAYLAKPVALAGIVPLFAMVWERIRAGRTIRPTALAVLIVVPLFILYFYQRRISDHAEWHWSSSIMTLHVLPSLRAAFTNVPAFLEKAEQFWSVLGMLAQTMAGYTTTALAILGILATPWVAARSKGLLWGWLAGGLVYTYVVVTVERVDYYMFLLLPLAALFVGALTVACVRRLAEPSTAIAARAVAAVAICVVLAFTIAESRAAIAPYYKYNHQAYQNAVELSRTLDPAALVVIGHYGPDVLYEMNRFGWEEDPLAWTPFDEESAIRKGARYYVSIEDNRMHRNAALCAWLQRFPVTLSPGYWPVYQTDPAKVLPGANAFWAQFQSAEAKGRARAFLDARHLCQGSGSKEPAALDAEPRSAGIPDSTSAR